ncbi:MAG: hypothetical protein QOJ06_293 [Pseudonocardiales bacterium]|nr:hypothetical protein [Pseudonocardiales bacterium]
MVAASHAPHPVLYRPVTNRVTNGASGTASGEPATRRSAVAGWLRERPPGPTADVLTRIGAGGAG